MGILSWRLELLASKFGKKRNLFLQTATQWDGSGRQKDAAEIRSLCQRIEDDIKSLRQAHRHGGLNLFQFAWKLRGACKMFRQVNEGIKSATRQFLEAFAIIGTVFVFGFHFIASQHYVSSGSAEPTMLVGDRLVNNRLAYRFFAPERGDLVIFDNPFYDVEKTGAISQFIFGKLGLTMPFLGIGPDAWTKRLIGLPGDIIEGRIEADGRAGVYVNGEKLAEPKLNPHPLIGVKKQLGFIPIKTGLPILSWFERKTKEVLWYTYDPSVSREKQQFYSLDKLEILRNPYSGEPFYRRAEVGEPHDVFGPMRVDEGKMWVQGDSRKNSRDSRDFSFVDMNHLRGRASFITFSVDTEEDMFIFELIKHPIDFWLKKVRWSRFLKVLR